MRCLFFTLFYLFQYNSFSQNLITATVVDSTNKKVIPYSSIKFINLQHGTFCDSSGKFQIPATMLKDSFIVTSIGYISKTTNLSNGTYIYLEPNFVALDAVVIAKKELVNEKTYGITKLKPDFRWGPSGFGDEFAQKICIDLKSDQSAIVKEISIQAKFFNPDKPVLLHVYSVNAQSGVPEKELLTNKYFLTKANFKGTTISINLESEHLVLSESCIYVSFEWLGSSFNPSSGSTNRSLLLMTTKVPDKLTYSRTNKFKSNNWFPAPVVSPNQLNPTNTIFSIKVSYYQ